MLKLLKRKTWYNIINHQPMNFTWMELIIIIVFGIFIIWSVLNGIW